MTTPPLLSSLDDNAKLVLIAERCGWSEIGFAASLNGLRGLDPFGSYEPIPDYCHSLDAMALAEQTEWTGDLRKLYNDTATHHAWGDYKELLNHHISASASQRADAFLLATRLAQ